MRSVPKASSADAEANGEKLEIPLVLGASPAVDEEGSLSLTTASGWAEVSVSGCASGHSRPPSRLALPAAIEIFRGDRGCVAALHAFENGGRECRKSDGSAMTGVGPDAFRCGSDVYWVTRVSGFGAAATSGTQLGWAFGRIDKGAPKRFITIGPPARVASGTQPGPHLALLASRGVGLTGLSYANARNDFPTFTFTLACGRRLTSMPDACPDSTGSPQDFERMSAALVPDTYGGDPSEGQLFNIFKSGAGIVDGGVFAVLAPGGEAGPNGGTRFSAAMQADLDTNTAMLLVVRYLVSSKSGDKGGKGGKGNGGGGGNGSDVASYFYQPVRFVLAP